MEGGKEGRGGGKLLSLSVRPSLSRKVEERWIIDGGKEKEDEEDDHSKSSFHSIFFFKEKKAYMQISMLGLPHLQVWMGQWRRQIFTYAHAHV